MSIYETIDLYKKEIDKLRPFEGKMLEQIKAYYKIGLTWSSNALEGNTYTESETNLAGKNVFVFITQADEKTPSLVYESIATRVEAKGGKVIDSFFVQTDMKSPLTSEQARKPVAEWINRNGREMKIF